MERMLVLKLGAGVVLYIAAGAGEIAIVYGRKPEPPEPFVAVMVKLYVPVGAIGVPEMSPVEGFRLSPGGSAPVVTV